MPVLEKRVYDERDYQVNVGALYVRTDTLASVVSVIPFRFGETEQTTELRITNIAFSGDVIFFRATGGVQYKTYTLQMRFTTTASQPEVIEAEVTLVVR